MKDKVALVTGASRGIGQAIAQTLAGYGMAVALAARSGDALKEVANGIEGRGGKAMVFTADLADKAAAGKLVAAAMERFGRIDLVVNNAGATKRGDFLTLTDEDWHDGYELKLHGAVRLCRAAWPELVKTLGAIVNIAGVGGRTASAEFTLGGSVNAAIALFTKALADRGVTDGVRVNCIHPGAIATDRLNKRISKVMADESVDATEAARRLAARERIARFGTPEEIAEVVAFLASDRAAYIQGSVIDVDGGLTRAL